MGTHRRVRVEDGFFAELERKLRACKEAGAIPVPSATNFLLHELPRALDALAEDFEGATDALDGEAFVRMWLGRGRYVSMFAVFATLDDDGAVAVVSVDLEL